MGTGGKASAARLRLPTILSVHRGQPRASAETEALPHAHLRTAEAAAEKAHLAETAADTLADEDKSKAMQTDCIITA